jgi:hypothetical protein
MNVGAVIVEELEYSGNLRSFQMWADAAGPITIALADDFDQLPSGPFHFRQEYYKEKFEKGFAKQTNWKLPESRFTVRNGEYRFSTSWKDIPTERNSLSCYSLSLPPLAIPSHIRFTDPYSDREYSKSVIRDNRRHRFVANLECRSAYGSFAFELEVRFKMTTHDNFLRAVYNDQHISRHAPHANPFEYPASHNWQQVIQRHLPPNDEVAQPRRTPKMSLQHLEGLKGNNSRLRRMVYRIYAQLRKEISQARIAVREAGLNIESIRNRFPILGGASEESIRKFILTNPKEITARNAAIEIMSRHTELALSTLARYTRK